jgi:hypothetical protein
MRLFRLSILATLVIALATTALAPRAEAGRPLGGGSDGGGSKGAIPMTGDQVVPGPGDLTGAATAKVSISAKRGLISFYITVQSLTGLISTIQIYEAPAGSAGSPVIRLSPNDIGIAGLNGDPILLTDISRNPQNYYVQINTNMYPDGAVRCQLK